MNNYIEPIARLVNQFTKLPGVGVKTALRYAYTIINSDSAFAKELASAVLDAKVNVKFCKVCGALSENDICDICLKRSKEQICVVKETKDVLAIERLGEFKGQYHVLNGTISPLNGVTPDDIRIRELLARVTDGGVNEVIVATNPDLEGDVTAQYIAKLLKPFDVKVTRIACGVSIGSELENADDVTLSKALNYRTEL